MGQNHLMAEIQRRAPSAVSVVGAAFRVVEWQLGLARELILLPARVLALVDDVEVVVERIQDLLDEVNRTVRAIDGIVASATTTVDASATTTAAVIATITSSTVHGMRWASSSRTGWAKPRETPRSPPDWATP